MGEEDNYVEIAFYLFQLFLCTLGYPLTFINEKRQKVWICSSVEVVEL